MDTLPGGSVPFSRNPFNFIGGSTFNYFLGKGVHSDHLKKGEQTHNQKWIKKQKILWTILGIKAQSKSYKEKTKMIKNKIQIEKQNDKE